MENRTVLHLAAEFVTAGPRHGSPSMLQRRINQEHDIQIDFEMARRLLADLYGAGVVAPVDQRTHAHPVLMDAAEAQAAVDVYTERGEGLNWGELYACPQCWRVAPWTDGRGIRYGDEVDEFWCQTCGVESRLEVCEKRSLQAA